MCSPAMTKATVDPSQGQGVKWLLCLTPQLKKGLKGDHRITADRTEVAQVLQGREASL